MAISMPANNAIKPGWSLNNLLTGFHWNIKLNKGVKQISPDEIIRFFDQLSLMLDTGTPLNRSIQAISTQVKNEDFNNILKDIEKEIEEGKLLSAAIAKYPGIFSPVYTSMIRAGETGGFLKDMLERIVLLEGKHQKLISVIRAAMYYPAFLCIFASSVVLFIVVYVFPKFGEMFEEIYDSLPVTTKILMGTSRFLISYWHFIIICTGILCITAYKLIITDKGKAYLDIIKLRTPIIKNFFIRIYLSRLMSTLGSLIGSNVSLLESLTICAGGIGNKVFENLIENIKKDVEGGKPLSQPISMSPYFPEIVKQMVRTGEETGMLHKVMPRLADYYDAETERSIKKLTTIMEPILLVFVGGIVGTIVISLILPIFKLSRSMH